MHFTEGELSQTNPQKNVNKKMCTIVPNHVCGLGYKSVNRLCYVNSSLSLI